MRLTDKCREEERTFSLACFVHERADFGLVA
jgi:hypothetical protein